MSILIVLFKTLATICFGFLIYLLFITIKLAVDTVKSNKHIPNQDSNEQSPIKVRDYINKSIIMTKESEFNLFTHKKATYKDRIRFEILYLRNTVCAFTTYIIIDETVNITDAFINNEKLSRKKWTSELIKNKTVLVITLYNNDDIALIDEMLFVSYETKEYGRDILLALNLKEIDILNDMLICYRDLVL